MLYSCSMTKRVRHRLKTRRRIFLKEWRDYRGLTQEQLAERCNMSVSNVSQLERGLQGYSDEGLALLADALNCEPGQILWINPLDEDSVWSLWERALPPEREVVKANLKIIVGKRSTG